MPMSYFQVADDFATHEDTHSHVQDLVSTTGRIESLIEFILDEDNGNIVRVMWASLANNASDLPNQFVDMQRNLKFKAATQDLFGVLASDLTKPLLPVIAQLDDWYAGPHHLGPPNHDVNLLPLAALLVALNANIPIDETHDRHPLELEKIDELTDAEADWFSRGIEPFLALVEVLISEHDDRLGSSQKSDLDDDCRSLLQELRSERPRHRNPKGSILHGHLSAMQKVAFEALDPAELESAVGPAIKSEVESFIQDAISGPRTLEAAHKIVDQLDVLVPKRHQLFRVLGWVGDAAPVATTSGGAVMAFSLNDVFVFGALPPSWAAFVGATVGLLAVTARRVLSSN